MTTISREELIRRWRKYGPEAYEVQYYSYAEKEGELYTWVPIRSARSRRTVKGET